MQPIDEDHIFLPATEAWLEETKQQIFTEVGKHDAIRADEFIQQIPERRIIIPKWFRMLILQAREYQSVRGNNLEFVPLPDTAKEWRDAHPTEAYDDPLPISEQREQANHVQTCIEDEMLNEIDTHGIDQSYAPSEYGAPAEIEDEDSGDDVFAYASQGRYRPAPASV